MTHAHLGDSLAQAYVDGAVSDREAERCSAHTAGCAECRLLVESYRILADDLGALPDLEPDLDFTTSVMSAIDEKERVAARERRHAFGLVGLAACAAAALFATAGAAAWAPTLTSISELLNATIHAVQLGFDVGVPIASALRAQILVACVVVSLPLLLAIRQLVPSEAPARS